MKRLGACEEEKKLGETWKALVEKTPVEGNTTAAPPAATVGMCVQILRFLTTECCAQLRVCCSNAKLDAMRSTIHEHGAEYLRKKFQQGLDAKEFTSEHVTNWANATVRELLLAGKQVDTKHFTGPRVHNISKMLLNNQREGYEEALIAGIVNLVAGYEEKTAPETLRLDILRFKAVQMHFHTDVLLANMLATLEQELDRYIDKDAKGKILGDATGLLLRSSPLAGRPKAIVNTIDLLVDGLREMEPRLTEENLESIKNLISDHTNKEGLVYKRMVNVFKGHVYQVGCAKHNLCLPCISFHNIMLFEQGISSGTLQTTISNAGLPESASALVERVNKWANQIARVAWATKKIHWKRYESLFEKAVELYKPS
jgi:hypothetical protein